VPVNIMPVCHHAAMIGAMMTLFLNYYNDVDGDFPLSGLQAFRPQARPEIKYGWRRRQVPTDRTAISERLDQAHEAGDVVSRRVIRLCPSGGRCPGDCHVGKSTMTGIGQLLTLYRTTRSAGVDGAGSFPWRAARSASWRWCWRLSPGVMVAASLAGHVLQARPGFHPDK